MDGRDLDDYHQLAVGDHDRGSHGTVVSGSPAGINARARSTNRPMPMPMPMPIGQRATAL